MADEFALIQAAIKDNICVALANGGAAGNHTVTGMTSTSRIVFVGHLSTAAAIATLADLTSEFTAGTDLINNTGGTDTTSDQLMVIYVKS
jgi:predicted nucleotide-binding protein